MFQIVLVTRHWTKFNIAAVCVSVVVFFTSTKFTQSPFLYLRSPSDYPFFGKLLLVPASLDPECGHLYTHLCRNCRTEMKKTSVLLIDWSRRASSLLWTGWMSLCVFHQVRLITPWTNLLCGSQLCSPPGRLFYPLWPHLLSMSSSRSMTNTRWDVRVTKCNVMWFWRLIKNERTASCSDVTLTRLWCRFTMSPGNEWSWSHSWGEERLSAARRTPSLRGRGPDTASLREPASAAQSRRWMRRWLQAMNHAALFTRWTMVTCQTAPE